MAVVVACAMLGWAWEEVTTVPTDTITTNDRVETAVTPAAPTKDEELRRAARKQLENVRKFKLYLSAYVLGMLVLTPVWALTEYLNADGWPERFSEQSNPGDWNPWILWVALGGLLLVGIAALRAYFTKPITEADVDREVERLTSRR
jgi:hypothetical protein